ncbi:NmrA family protein [Pseudohyphozyma bogoriensis]|nr:NmrA family protein [Pseudohyphozyma bogoriensis]
MSPPIVLITGASGRQGGAVIDALLDGGHPKVLVRALVRSSSLDTPASKALASRGVELVPGDFSDETSLRKGLTGVSSLFLLTTRQPSGPTAEVDNSKTLISLAHSSGVSHIVYSSVDGADEGTGVPHFEDKFAVEKFLKASGGSWTILRPSAFFENFPGRNSFKSSMMLGLFDMPLRGRRYPFVAVKDIGWFAARALEDPTAYSGRTIAIASEQLSMPAAQAAYGRTSGSSASKAWLPSILIRALPENERKMMQWMQTHDGEGRIDIDALRREHPGLLTFEKWLELQQ